MAKVTRPHRLRGRATAQIHAHGDFLLLHHALAVGLLVRRVAAAIDHHVHIVQVQIDLGLVQIVDTGVTHGRQDATQVRVGRKERGLHQRRMRNGVSRQAAFGFGLAAVNLHGNELGGTFAVAHDGLGQQARHVQQRSLQDLRIGAVPAGDWRIAGLVGGHQHKGVIGGGIAINRHAVERAIGQFFDQVLQQRWGNCCIGGQVAQHGGHIGADHARALADAGGGDGLATHHHLAAVGLGLGVGGHDAFGSQRPVVGLGTRNRSGQTGHDAIDRQLFHDHTGGKRQNLLRRYAQLLGQHGAGGTRIGQACSTRARVGIAGIDHHGANALACGQMLATDLHRCGAITVLREHARHAGTFIEQKHAQVFAVGFAYTGFGHANTHTSHGKQLSGNGNRQIHRHCRTSYRETVRRSLWVKNHAAQRKTRACARVL